MTFLTNDELVGRAKKRLKPALVAYVEQSLRRCGQQPRALAKIYFQDKRDIGRPIALWDTSLLLRFIKASWKDVTWDGLELPLVSDLLEVRNLWAHEVDFSEDVAERACALIDRFLEAVSPSPGPKVRATFTRKLKKERGDPSWSELLWRLWPDDWRGNYVFPLDDVENLRGVRFCGSSGISPPGIAEGVSPYILPMDQSYRKAPTNSAQALAAKLLDSMNYRNSAVFLALDEACALTLKEEVCRFRAWEEVLRGANDQMPLERDGVQASLDQSYRAVLNQLQEGYRWLIIPAQATLEGPLEWKVIHLEGLQNPVQCAGQELERVGGVLKHLDPRRLAQELARMPLWQAANHVPVSEVVLEFSRHLHLPRLKNWDVVEQSIAEGLATPGWSSFAYAQRCADTGEYIGLYFRGEGEKPAAGLLQHRIGLVVKPQAARAQLRRG